MATHSMPPADLLDHLASAAVDALHTILQHALQRLSEAEATAYIGAAPGEHTPERRTYRNGHRARPFDTRLGRLELQIPSCGRAASSRACWSHADGSSGRCWR